MRTPGEYIEKLKTVLSEHPELGGKDHAVFQFIVKGAGGGEWWMDLSKKPGEIGAGESDKAECTISMDAKDFVAMLSKESKPLGLFMAGKLEATGDLTLALKLQDILNYL